MNSAPVEFYIHMWELSEESVGHLLTLSKNLLDKWEAEAERSRALAHVVSQLQSECDSLAGQLEDMKAARHE